MKVSEICKYAPKSNIKAGDACNSGKYMFFTSSSDESKRYSNYQNEGEGIIMGTGGNATLHYYNGKYAVSTDCVVLLPDKQIRCKYLYYFFIGNMRILEDGFKGAGLKHTNKGYIGGIDIGDIPSFEKQDKIIRIFDSLQKIIDLRKNEIDKLDDLIKARFVEMFGDPVANPMKWTVKKLKDLSVQINSGNTPKGGSENYVEEGITFFRSQNVWKDRLEMDDIAYIDAETHASMKKSSLKHGDILMTKTGRINTENSSLGRAALYEGEDDMANVNGHVYFIRLKEGVNNKFVLRILVSPEYRDLIRSVCVGGIDKRQLNKEHIEDFPIICPPADMVDDYVTFVRQVDKSKVAVQQALTEAQLLFDSLMQKYFG